MTIRNLSVLLTGLLACSAYPARAQETVPPEISPVPTASGGATKEKPKKAKKDNLKHAWETHVSLSSVFDDNIDQNEDSTDSRGFIAEFGTRFTQDLPSGSFEFSYAIARHSFTNTDVWDRTTHDIEAALEHRLGRRWTSETIGEIALKDASDDGDIRDEYRLVQRIEYRLAQDWRLRADGALRFKRNSVGDEGKDARDPYLGGRLELTLPNGNWRLGYRYDDNEAKDSMRSYRRSTWQTSMERELGKRDTATLEVGYERRRYTERVIGTPTGPAPRRDHGWEVNAEWEHEMRKDLALTLNFVFENRRSNDSRREYDDHLVGATITRTW